MTFFPIVFVFGIIPLLDWVIGADSYNAPETEMRVLAGRFGFRALIYLYVPVQISLVVWGAYVVTRRVLSPAESIGLVASIGMVSGSIGITMAHELIHSRSRLERSLGQILLMTVFYMHFSIEHIRGHHQNVGTSKDPATARLGESIYSFYPRTVIHSFRNAWKLEVRRLTRGGLPVWSFHNEMIWDVVLPSCLVAVLGIVFGGKAMVFFLIQSVIAFSLLEAVNYIEHYGLERREMSAGRYEKVTPGHSWNSNHRLTNYFLIQLPRHSDHHVYSDRRYQTLRSFEESPQLPTGYAGTILLALIPPLWRAVMDARVHEFRRTRLPQEKQLMVQPS